MVVLVKQFRPLVSRLRASEVIRSATQNRDSTLLIVLLHIVNSLHENLSHR